MNDAREKRLANLATINSSTKVQERTAMIRATLWKLLGGPLERTPLNPKVTGRHDRGYCRIESVIFESFPQVYVTANLYIPL